MQTSRIEQFRLGKFRYFQRRKEKKDKKTFARVLFIIKLKKLKGGKCEICGYDKNFSCLDFHHLSKKNFNIGASVTGNYPKDRIIEEVTKCQLLCRNCHSDLHHPNYRTKFYQE